MANNFLDPNVALQSLHLWLQPANTRTALPATLAALHSQMVAAFAAEDIVAVVAKTAAEAEAVFWIRQNRVAAIQTEIMTKLFYANNTNIRRRRLRHPRSWRSKWWVRWRWSEW